jgi:serine/threonine-protein kinase
MGPEKLEGPVDEVDAHHGSAWYSFDGKEAWLAEASQHRAHGRVGTTIRGKYRIDAFLAAGTMANVYAATHRNGSKVALKILHRELASDPALRERFKREGYFANSIGHEGVIRAIDDDVTEDGCAYLVMELLEGETLEERRRRLGGKVPLRQALDVVDLVLGVLAAAHAKDVLHRDVKPDNVFITRTGAVKVLDFGVARFNDGKSSSDMTGTGMVLGTPAFMPPEQALGRRHEVDARSDLWGVGATLFVALTGQPVHAGGDAKQKLIATARTPARPIRDVAPEVPRAVASVVDRALAFHRDDRWESALAMREALRWARRAIDGDHELPERGSVPDELTPAQTRRKLDDLIGGADDEPTLARSASHPPGPMVSTSESVVTSAPPITMRDPGPTAPDSSMASGPVFSLRRGKTTDESPVTERSTEDGEAPTSQSATLVGKDIARLAALSVAVESTASPREAREALGGEPPTARPPLGATLPLASPSAPTSDANWTFTRPMPAVHVPPEIARPGDGAGAGVPDVPSEGTVPPNISGFANLAPTYGGAEGSPAPAAFPSATPAPAPPAPPPFASAPCTPTAVTSTASATVDAPPNVPGPALTEIMTARRRGQGLRVGLMVLVALLAGVGAYVVVVRHRTANARSAAAAAESARAAVSTAPSAAPPPPVPAPDPSATAAHTAAPAASASATPAPTASPPKKKRRPRPPPAATATATATATSTATATATATDTPEPPPAPDPPKTADPPKTDPPSTEGP